MIALHFVRSLSFFTNAQYLTQTKLEELAKSTPPELHEKLLIIFKNRIIDSTPQMMVDLYRLVKAELINYKLQIAEASVHENFIIGDIPIINEKKALMESNFLFLPLTPRFLISVSKTKDKWKLSTKITRKIKKMVKEDSHQYWFCYPNE